MIFKVRASASGKIMTKPRSKSEVLSQTTKSYVQEWLKERIYGIKKDFSSKYTQKGIEVEDEAIEKAIEWLDLPFALKNEKYFENDFFTGTPDLILSDEVIDIKCSWDAFSFPLFETELPTKDYYYQLQVYMHLTGKRKSRVVYVLLNTPEEISPYEQKHDYSYVDKKYRIKTFEVDYDESIIEELKQRVVDIRAYIEKIKL